MSPSSGQKLGWGQIRDVRGVGGGGSLPVIANGYTATLSSHLKEDMMSTVTQLPNGQNRSDSYVMRVRGGAAATVGYTVYVCMCVRVCRVGLLSLWVKTS